MLRRHLKPAAEKLGLPMEIDFRSFRTMHASLMRRVGGRLEVARRATGSITLDVYSKSWWEERVDAVTAVVEAVFTEPEEKQGKTIATPLNDLTNNDGGANWVPSWVPQCENGEQIST